MLMNPIVWLAAGVAGIVIVALMLRTASRRSETQLTAVRQEMQSSLAAQLQAVAGQLNHLMQGVTQQLGQVRQELMTRRRFHGAVECTRRNATSPSN